MNQRTEIRRRDRSQDDAWIRRFLAEVPFGFLAISSEGPPHLHPNLFVYVEEDHAIYMHTARTGRTPEMIEAPVPVTFSAGVVGRLLPADEALEFSVEYASVVVYGRAVKMTDAPAKRRALQHLLNRYAPHLRPGRDYRPITDQELDRTGVYQIDVEAWTGKEKAAPADFAGAVPTASPAIPLHTKPEEES